MPILDRLYQGQAMRLDIEDLRIELITGSFRCVKEMETGLILGNGEKPETMWLVGRMAYEESQLAEVEGL